MVNIVRTLFNLDKKPEPEPEPEPEPQPEPVETTPKLDPNEFKHRLSATLRTKKEEEE
jgi:hypothetical protein